MELKLHEARQNGEVISISDSQIVRWIDEMNGVINSDERARAIKKEIKRIRKEPNCAENLRDIRSLYDLLDSIQFKPDIMSLVIDKAGDYYRACQGFYINGIKYVRLLGTPGGVKTSTIFFISERLSEEIRVKIDNGRNPEKALVPAKFEAYRALTCSASTPVSFPKGIVIVNDCITKFKADIIELDDEGEGEPVMTYKEKAELENNASDGYGLICPALAERWSEELRLGYTACAFNTRFAWEKGMVFTFDFQKFAKDVAGSVEVKDVWGESHDIRNVEMVLTESQVKMWDSYESFSDYMNKSLENGYSFSVTKTAPKELENERNLNYQYIQSYDLDDEDIKELIAPSVNEIKDILGGDYRKSILFLRGKQFKEEHIEDLPNDWAKALMIEPALIHDPYIISRIKQAIKKRIDETKIGVVKVHANYSIIGCDPFALCQNMFNMPVTGILKAGEIYSRYWQDYGSKVVACFRSPMSCHSNIRKLKIHRSYEADEWFKYIDTCTILNAWDTTCAALNGADYDGDIIMCTDNPVLLRRHKELPAVFCAQRKAPKLIPTEDILIETNIKGFGNGIGKITNRITEMYDLLSVYNKDSEEYKTLEYRIICGQLYQQNEIDSMKGVITKPMPVSWYDGRVNMPSEGDSEETLKKKQFNMRIVANEKPYFMTYIYPELRKRYNNYKKAVRHAVRIKPEFYNKQGSSHLALFIECGMPVSNGESVMNRLCKMVEKEFLEYNIKVKEQNVSSDILKYPDISYKKQKYKEIERVMKEYPKRLNELFAEIKTSRRNDDENALKVYFIKSEFQVECQKICPDERELCNIMADMSKSQRTRQYYWDICGAVAVELMLKRHDDMIEYPVLDESGDLIYAGDRFSWCSKKIEHEREEAFDAQYLP